MNLSLFLADLMLDGNVVVPRKIIDLDSDDIEASLVLLEDFYKKDVLTMPGHAPAFNKGAALWAAKYIFHVCQLILLRDVNEIEIGKYLQGFDGEQSPAVIYSADLLLRFLPDLFRLASGLSPEDPLVTNLKKTAFSWPYSAIGLKDIKSTINSSIINDFSLRLSYIDRIIGCKDVSCLNGEDESALLKEVLGKYQSVLWPELELLIRDKEFI